MGGATLPFVAFEFIGFMFILVNWYFRPLVKGFGSRDLFVIYAQAVVGATWFIGVRVAWYCHLRVQEVAVRVYATLFVESQFGMVNVTRFCLFKGNVFCQLFEESTRQILRDNLGIFRRLTAYEREFSIKSCEKEIVVRRPEVSSLAILGGRRIVRNAVSGALYRIFG